MRVRSAIIWLAVLVVVGVFGAGPAWAKKSVGVYLSTAGSEADGWNGAAWEKEGVTLSANLKFSTSAGDTECATRAPSVFLENGGRLPAVLLAETTSASCSGSNSSSPSITGYGGKALVWYAFLDGSGAVPICTGAFVDGVYFTGGCEHIGATAVTVAVGALQCTYGYHKGMKRATMPGGSFTLDSSEARPVEITLPPVQFELSREESKSSEYSGCPATGELNAHFTLATENDGPVLARAVEPHQEIVVTPGRVRHPKPGTAKARPCEGLAEGSHTCVVHLTNGDKTESLEIREIFLGKPNKEYLMRIPTGDECVGSTESTTPTVLAPGQTCNVAIETTVFNFEKYFPSSELFVVTTSQPGGVPEEEDVSL